MQNHLAGSAPAGARGLALAPETATFRGAEHQSSLPAQAAASFKLAVTSAAPADTCFAAAVKGAELPSPPLEQAAACFKLAAAAEVAADVCFANAFPIGGTRCSQVPGVDSP